MNQHATIEDLARAADDAGAALAQDAGDLADSLAPRRLMDDAVSAVKIRSAGLARDAGGAVKSHPLVSGAAVIAVGLALYAGSRISRAELDIDRDLDGYTDYEDTALTAAAVESAGAASGIGRTAKAKAAKARAASAGATDTGVADDARALVKENPVIAILAGLAAGAALALLFPTSGGEKRSLGAVARSLMGH